MAVVKQVPAQPYWYQRYTQLLTDNGLDSQALLTSAIASAMNAGAGKLSLAQCLEEPERLTRQICVEYPDAAKDRRLLRAYQAVLQQDLALSVLSPLTLKLFRDGQVCLPEPQSIFLASVEPESAPASRWFYEPSGSAVIEDGFVQKLSEMTEAWYPIFRKNLGVSPGAYWSSIGLGLGAPFSVVWNQAEPKALCSLAQGWLEEFSNSANQFIDWIPAIFGGQQCAIPQRRGCCLKYLLPNGNYCGTCGVYRKQRMAARKNPGRLLD